jgi:hypothetical protein
VTMRKIFFAIIGMLVIATFFSCTTSRFSSYTPVESNELLFSETYDEFKGTITWIRHNYFLSNSGERPFYLYIGIHKDGVMLRGVFTYRGRGWINFSRVVMTYISTFFSLQELVGPSADFAASFRS